MTSNRRGCRTHSREDDIIVLMFPPTLFDQCDVILVRRDTLDRGVDVEVLLGQGFEYRLDVFLADPDQYRT